MSEQQKLEKITTDLLKPIRLNMSFKIWMGFLTISLLICLYAYTLQLKTGLGVAGIRDYVSWGMYIANFVFFMRLHVWNGIWDIISYLNAFLHHIFDKSFPVINQQRAIKIRSTFDQTRRSDYH